MLDIQKDSKKEGKKLKPWERKNPWDDASDHQQERWRHENILSLDEKEHPQFTLAKNKARFYRMLAWYKEKQKWLDVAPFSATQSLLRQQKKELGDIRSDKLNYEWELEKGSLTPSQQSYRRDELKMCEVHEKMAVSLMSKIQSKMRSLQR